MLFFIAVKDVEEVEVGFCFVLKRGGGKMVPEKQKEFQLKNLC